MFTLTMATSRMSKYSPGLQLKHWTEGTTAIFVSECLRLKWLDLCLYHSHQASAVILENGLQTDSKAPRLTLSVNTALFINLISNIVYIKINFTQTRQHLCHNINFVKISRETNVHGLVCSADCKYSYCPQTISVPGRDLSFSFTTSQAILKEIPGKIISPACM